MSRTAEKVVLIPGTLEFGVAKLEKMGDTLVRLSAELPASSVLAAARNLQMKMVMEKIGMVHLNAVDLLILECLEPLCG